MWLVGLFDCGATTVVCGWLLLDDVLVLLDSGLWFVCWWLASNWIRLALGCTRFRWVRFAWWVVCVMLC